MDSKEIFMAGYELGKKHGRADAESEQRMRDAEGAFQRAILRYQAKYPLDTRGTKGENPA